MSAHKGNKLMGVSLSRKGSSHVMATGAPAAHGESPKMSGHAQGRSKAMWGHSMKRGGNHKIADYPNASGFNPAHKGGKGTGQGNGMNG
jgi:hypothetical protein